MKTKRTYTMASRAKAAEETRLRILRAAFDLQSQSLASAIGLAAVAQAAGVSVQTILRRFGSRDGLFDEAIRHANQTVTEERRAPVGDVAGALHVIVEHYERRGDFALMMLAQETTYEHVRRMSDAGKATHRTWVTEVFSPQLAPLTPAQREETTDLLVVATDVYAWKLLRRDRGLSRIQTEQRLNTLVTAILTAADRKDT
jgi:AcrR family transcriptional regulator